MSFIEIETYELFKKHFSKDEAKNFFIIFITGKGFAIASVLF
jgi:hypothetical protein